MNKSNQLIWIRSDRKKADVWLAHKDGKHEMKWIENIDVPNGIMRNGIGEMLSR